MLVSGRIRRFRIFWKLIVFMERSRVPTLGILIYTEALNFGWALSIYTQGMSFSLCHSFCLVCWRSSQPLVSVVAKGAIGAWSLLLINSVVKIWFRELVHHAAVTLPDLATREPNLGDKDAMSTGWVPDSAEPAARHDG